MRRLGVRFPPGSPSLRGNRDGKETTVFVTAVDIKNRNTAKADILRYQFTTKQGQSFVAEWGGGTTLVLDKTAGVAFFKRYRGCTEFLTHNFADGAQAPIGLNHSNVKTASGGWTSEWLQTYADDRWDNNL